MAPRELARLQCPLDDEAGLFGLQRLGEILIGGGARECVAQFDIRFLADEENPHEVCSAPRRRALLVEGGSTRRVVD